MAPLVHLNIDISNDLQRNSSPTPTPTAHGTDQISQIGHTKEEGADNGYRAVRPLSNIRNLTSRSRCSAGDRLQVRSFPSHNRY